MGWVKSSAAFLGMLAFYFAALTILGRGWGFAWSRFAQYWWLVLSIAATFAGQVYLSTNLKMAAGSGGISGAAMVACCAHHVAEFLPFLGLFTAASFIIRYQFQFMLLALLLNLASLFYLWMKRRNYNTT